MNEVLTAEELLKLKAEVGAAPPGFSFEIEPVVTTSQGLPHNSAFQNVLLLISFTSFYNFPSISCKTILLKEYHVCLKFLGIYLNFGIFLQQMKLR